MPVLIVSGATIIGGAAKGPVEGQSLWIEDGRIKALPRSNGLKIPPQATIVDARGKYVIPGLMNANVHLLADKRMETLVRHMDRYEDLIAEAAQVALKNGVTTVFDTNGPRKPLIGVRDRIDRGEVAGSRIFCAGWIIGMDGPFSTDFYPKAAEVASNALVSRINSLCVENVGPDLMWMTPDQVGQEVRTYICRGIDFIKYASNDHSGASLIFSERVQSAIVAEAHRAGTTAQAHTMSVEGLRVAIEAGCDLIQHVNVTGPVPIPDTTLQLLVEKGTGVVVFPFTQRRLDAIISSDHTGGGWMRRAFASADINCRNLIHSKASVMLATDGGIWASDVVGDPVMKDSWAAPGPDNLNDLGEGHFAWLKAMEEKGMAPMEMLRAATCNVAIAYGKNKDLGTLEPGKIADLVLLDHDPLQAAENYRSIHLIVKDGVIVDRGALPANPILTKPAEPLTDVTSYGRYAISRFPPCC